MTGQNERKVYGGSGSASDNAQGLCYVETGTPVQNTQACTHSSAPSPRGAWRSWPLRASWP
eukprot:1667687-Pleurochrysis_carterae.AAC.1